MLSIALPGAGWPRSGSAITTGFTQATFWRISSVGPGGPSGGKAPGSITGGTMARAAGAATHLGRQQQRRGQCRGE